MIDFRETTNVDESIINARVKSIILAESNFFNRKKGLKTILGMIDLTTLEGSDTDEKVIKLCDKAKKFSLKGKEIPNVAAVCVYPTLVKTAKKALRGTDIKVASVAGAFPSGQSTLAIKIAEINYAISEGADEIDMVISRGKFLEGEYNLVFDEIAAIKDFCRNVHLKVILETGELQTLTNVYRASMMAMHAGADFIKTSTGKINPAATEQATLVMLDAINDFYNENNKMVGMKPAGGISEPSTAFNYLKLLEITLDKKWHNKEWFRFGASKLADKIVEELLKN
jgi:deoxyribose-phosphate aldolase